MQRRYVLITGGAGFIGTNMARAYLAEGQPVYILDNFSRAGVKANVAELQRQYPRELRIAQADVQNRLEVEKAVENAKAVYHFAAQVAVTNSLHDPMADLDTNLIGTMRILEAVRRSGNNCPVLFTSTNKVYGKLAGVALKVNGTRWEPNDEVLARRGAGEDQPLEFLSPYGCSKGSADQYVLDYAHSFRLPATVFRMSCIYGPHQMGSEDQGWVAHFMRQAMKGEPVRIYGDGKQVRDLLFVEDLVQAMRSALEHMNASSGQAFNVGGGPRHSTSLVEVLDEIRQLLGKDVAVEWGDERLADQKWYVADTSKIERCLGWTPTTDIRTGLQALRDWYRERPALINPAMSEAEAQVA